MSKRTPKRGRPRLKKADRKPDHLCIKTFAVCMTSPQWERIKTLAGHKTPGRFIAEQILGPDHAPSL